MPAREPAEEGAAARRRTGLALFVLLLVTYGWFHQGGGWNQNARFAQVRAIVESGRLAIDDHLLYTLAVGDDGAARYRMIALSDPSASSRRVPRAVSLDVSTHAGHFYPNKPPGLSLLAVPGYAAAYAVLSLLGADPGDAFALTLCLYATTVLSVGVLSAAGGVAFHDVARRLFPGSRPGVRLAASLAYALGAPVFAYATFLIDHAVVASLSLLAFRSLLVARADAPGPDARPLLLAGALAGAAVAVNNSAAITAIGLGAYALAVLPGVRPAFVYAAGGIAPVLLLAAYGAACFGGPLDLPQDHQLAMFQTGAPVLGIFGAPRPRVVAKLLFEPYRGLFFWSPVLLAGAAGLLALLRRRGLRAEALLFGALFLCFALMNASFNAWHGGGTFGPRYLVPAIPFLALPLVIAFERAPRVTGLLAAVSVALALLVTTVSPQASAAFQRPLFEFYLPLARGEAVRSGSYLLRGPVSVHPTGFVGSGLESMTGTSETARWSSFNLGELVFPRSWASLLPLALLAAAIAWLGLRRRDAPGVPEGGA